MKTMLALLTALALFALPPAAAVETITIHLRVDTAWSDVAIHECDILVPADANGGDVLDAAVEQDCIVAWVPIEDDEYGRYVECIDVICGAVVTFWAIYINEEFASCGIDSCSFADGDDLTFTYDQWVVPNP